MSVTLRATNLSDFEFVVKIGRLGILDSNDNFRKRQKHLQAIKDSNKHFILERNEKAIGFILLDGRFGKTIGIEHIELASGESVQTTGVLDMIKMYVQNVFGSTEIWINILGHQPRLLKELTNEGFYNLNTKLYPNRFALNLDEGNPLISYESISKRA